MPIDAVNVQSIGVYSRDQCIAGAASHYGARQDFIRALIKTEGGRTGGYRVNSDGSYDYGLMQINSKHLMDKGPNGLSRFGITAADLVYNECLNIFIGTWYMQSRIVARNDLWVGVGDYRSRTPSINKDYQQRVYKALQEVWAEQRR